MNRHLKDFNIEEMQRFYDEGHSLRDVQIKFGMSLGGWTREFLIKNLKTRRKNFYSPEEKRVKLNEHCKRYRQKIKKQLIEYKGGRCEKCGYDRCINCLAFHHKNPDEKEFSISSVRGASFEKLRKEVDKCMLLCSNCHGELHYNLSLLTPINNNNCSFPDQRLVN